MYWSEASTLTPNEVARVATIRPPGGPHRAEDAAGQRLQDAGGLQHRAVHHRGHDQPDGLQHARHAAPGEQLVEGPRSPIRARTRRAAPATRPSPERPAAPAPARRRSAAPPPAGTRRRTLPRPARRSAAPGRPASGAPPGSAPAPAGSAGAGRWRSCGRARPGPRRGRPAPSGAGVARPMPANRISARPKLGAVVQTMWRMWVNSSEPATAGARLVVSESGDILSPK